MPLTLREFTILPIVSATLSVQAESVDFKKDIRPILEKRCYSCHSEKAKKEKGGYAFDNEERVKQEIGPSFLIRPGDPGNSDFMAKVTRVDKHAMPPDAKDALSSSEIKKLRTWIEEGAVVDGGSNVASKSSSGLMPRTETPPHSQPMNWTNAEGKTIRASFVKIIGEKITLRMANGKSYEIAMSTLSADSQLQARKAAGASIR